ncbi:hypothetical protein GGS23DRAFT_550917 [Durotheca rogersii]|uniref:uncharacterized protein n=1 Tax=Durotheca rogersii TaxID=419775 RepID=UPI0022209D53|nr:uncharacterized protein GGS23DRAFT_550917 [Durotheca rogersii]KAI5866508.1 hypothetical protein GGS23DRAFT_550917 [Durotheca rogersii]
MPPTPESQNGDAPAYQDTTPTGSASYAPHNSDPSMVKVTRGHSCVLCQQRKVRCDKSKPCSNCVKAGVDCRIVPPQPPRRRKRHVPERDLMERLRKYEALLSQNGIQFDSLGPDVKIIDPGSAEDGDELEPDFIKRKSKESSVVDPDLISSTGETPTVPRTFKWFPVQREFQTTQDIHRDSSDEEDTGSTINQAYDQMFENPSGFPFMVGGQFESVTDQHPPPVQIFALWQIYLDNVDPLLKLTHTPTLQTHILDARTRLDKVSRSLEALMFSIYLMAITSIDEERCQLSFNESRMVLLEKYRQATQQALLNSGFMRHPDITLLQAYLLYLLGIRHFSDPRSLFCLTGIGVRQAQRMGLHRDGAPFHLSPFEVEERRRLWWNLAGFDRRIGELCGANITAISNGYSCKLPLNINDNDLHLHAKEPPPSHSGATEMIFSLTRLEFSRAPGIDKMRTRASESNPQGVGSVADHRAPSYIERLSAHLNETYLRFCDPEFPLHLMTRLMTQANICKMKITAGFFHSALIQPATLPAAEKEELVNHAINMIECDSMMQASPKLKGFLWYTQMHFPFLAYIYLLHDLHTRTTGDLCERAWATIIDHGDKRKMTTHMRSPMHLSFSPLFVKAWDAHAAAESALGRTLVAPHLITHMRQVAAHLPKTGRKRAPMPTPSPKMPVISGAYGMASQAPPVQPQDMPSMVPMYPEQDMYHLSQVDINRQLATAFPYVNFGGTEMDTNFFIQEMVGFIPQPPQPMGMYPNPLDMGQHTVTWQ